MTLRFESLTLRNFGPYRDVANLDLAVTDESPIVVIHGENTMGKTRLFRALRWCLYGSPELGIEPKAAVRSLEQYLNTLAYADGERDMQVGIRFSANGHRYHLTRTAQFDGGSPKLSADLRIDSEVVQQASIDAEIGRLLHPQISEFFLFDGELLGDFYDRLNASSERELLQRSIENVLGIPALQLAERDVTVLTDDVMSRQAKALKNKAETDKANKDLRNLKSQQESLDKDRLEYETSLRKAENDLEEVKDRIASVEELKADAREMETLEAQMRGDDASEKRLREEMKAVLANGWLAPAAAKLTMALERVVAMNSAAESRQNEIREVRDRVEVLQKQIHGGLCPTCKQALPPADEATRAALKESETELKRLRGEAGEGPDMQLERRIRALIDVKSNVLYQEKQSQLNRIAHAQFDRSRRLNSIKERLKDNDATKIRQLAMQQDKLETAIEQYESSIRQLRIRQDALSNQQNKLAGVLRRLSGTNPALQAEALFFAYVKTILSKTIERYQERTRSDVERTASAMFNKLIRDSERYQGLRISPNYRVELIGDHGQPMATSEGGRQLVALSLIGALKRAAVRGGPVVLDSPLGRLDTLHRENVLQKWVPELGSQAILLVQSGEISQKEARLIMGSRIGHEYRIYRPNNDPQEATIERTN